MTASQAFLSLGVWKYGGEFGESRPTLSAQRLQPDFQVAHRLGVWGVKSHPRTVQNLPFLRPVCLTLGE